MELSPPPLRSPRLRWLLPHGALTLAPIPSEDAVPASSASGYQEALCPPRGVWSCLASQEALPSGSGEMPNRFPLVGSSSKMQKRRALLPLGERAAATKWCLSGPTLQWRDGRGRIQACLGGEGACPTGGRLPQAGARKAGGELGRALRPAPAHSPSHPEARTRSCCWWCCCSCCRRLEAAGALKARLLPTASAAPGLFPSSSGSPGRGCGGCSLLQRGASSSQGRLDSEWLACRFTEGKKGEDALSQPPPSGAHAAEGQHRACVQEPLSSLFCSGHLPVLHSGQHLEVASFGYKSTSRDPLLTGYDVDSPLLKFKGEA